METGNDVAVSVTNARKLYGHKQILDHLNMRVEKGTIYGLLGASGCGKTTLLSCIVGRKNLNSGNVWVLGGEPGTAKSGVPGPRVGYMPQDVALVAEFTVQGAIFYFGRIFGMKEEALKEKFRYLSELLDLPPADRYIKNCSGGQQRRVSFAAALVSTPELLILDEPTVGLDPVLRESIWNYLLEITTNNNVAVIITTHYIEETRQAHKIGLMRQGKLLSENSPERLLNMFNTDSLEEVYFLLSRKQTEGRLYGIEAGHTQDDSFVSIAQSTSSSVVSMVMTDLNSSKDVLTPEDTTRKKTTKSKANAFRLNGGSMKALLVKNIFQLTRNPNVMAFMVLFPVFEMLAFFLAIGSDVKGIKLGIINDENKIDECSHYVSNETAIAYNGNKCRFKDLSCRFIETLDDPMINLIYYKDPEKARLDITHGIVAGSLYIPENFSKSLEARMSAGQDVTNKELNDSQIHTWLDMSNRQIGATIKYKLTDKIIDMLKSLFADCDFLAESGALPVKFEEEIYGRLDETYTVFMIPGVLMTIMFFMGATNTSSIIIADRLEGVWDRSIVAGVSSLEILITHFATQVVLVIIQTTLVLVLAFPIYQTEFIGNFGAIIVLTVMQGICGMVFGFLVSIVSNSHSMANIVTTGSFYPMIVTCGLVWPLEGMPVGLRWISKCLPFTIPIISLRNVIKKGWSLLHLEVINGVGIEILWILIFGVISTYGLRKNR